MAEHALPLRVYVAVYAALLVLTGVTVGVSLLDLGRPAIYVAMAVAVVKAGLVVGYFMHLKFDVRFNALVFLSALLFLAIFFVLTMIDLGTRADVVAEQGTFALREEQAAIARSKAAQQLERAAKKSRTEKR
jgi:cytochrome c oxidase subunit 4